MNIETVGLITYHHSHLKTEQVLQRFLTQKKYEFKVFALPFTPRKRSRAALFVHRPDQSDAVEASAIAEKHNIPYIVCDKDTEIDDSCDIYLILGAGILSAKCVADKKIINCHPGIIPTCRGLDAFKWAIYEMKPLGITLHYIDAQVDAGEIITIMPTNVYATDSLSTLARRHYENEIDCLCRFDEFLNNPHKPFSSPLDNIEPGFKRRMPLEVEEKLEQSFLKYTARFGK
jgi:phosphoribosylglycinamide formyltransferase 1